MAFNSLNRNEDRPRSPYIPIGLEEARLSIAGPNPEEARFLLEEERAEHCRTMHLNALREYRRCPMTLAALRAAAANVRRNLVGRPMKSRNPFLRFKSRRVEVVVDDEITATKLNSLLEHSNKDRNPYDRTKSRNAGGAVDDERRIRREIANSNERRRMQGINEGIDMLQRFLPVKENEKLSKAAVLHKMAERVQKLERETKVLGELNCRIKKGMVNGDHLNQHGEPLYKRRPRLWNPSNSREDACDSKQEVLHLRRQIALEKAKRMELEKKINNLESCAYRRGSSNSCKKAEDILDSSRPAIELDSLPVAHSPIYNGVIRHGSSSSTVPVSSSTTSEILSTTAAISSTVAESSSDTPELSFHSSLKDSDPSSESSAPSSQTDAALTLETMIDSDNSTRNNITLQANYDDRNYKHALNTIINAVKAIEGPNVFNHDLPLDHNLVSSNSSSLESVNVIQCVKNGEVISSDFDQRVC